MTLKLITFGSIGTLVETSELQRQAFNQAFSSAGLDWKWNKDVYRTMLSIQGGKNRIRHYADQTNTQLTDEQIQSIHADKSARFQQILIEDGIGLRDGVDALITSAVENGIKVAFVSTTSQANIQAIHDALDTPKIWDQFTLTTNSNTVEPQKPDPAVYQYVLNTLNVSKDEIIAIEDTHQSMMSPINAGITTIVTPGDYVQDQDFSQAAAIATPAQLSGLNWIKSLLVT